MSVFIKQAIHFPLHAVYIIWQRFGLYTNTLKYYSVLFLQYIHGTLTYVETNPRIKLTVWDSLKANVC